MTLLYLVQHGDKQRLPGDPGLTQIGAHQAARTGAHLAALAPTDLYTSPMRRARETAELIAIATGLDFHIDLRLRERLNWDGRQSIGEFLTDWARSTQDRDLRVGGSEWSRQAAERLRTFIAAICHRPGPVVAITHGGVTIDLLRTLPGDDAVDRNLITGGVAPCAITILDNQTPLLIASTEHLQDLPR